MVRFEAENHKHVVRVATTFCSFGADCFHDALPPAKAPLCFPVVLPVFMLYILGVMLLGCGGDTSAVSNNTDSGHFADADVGPSTTLDVAADTVPTSDVDDETLDTVIPQADTQDTPVPKCKHGEGCDDNNPCTSDDVCSDGSCAGTPYRCDDGIVCTMDACDGDGGCLHDVVGGACLINTVCYADHVSAETEHGEPLELPASAVVLCTQRLSADALYRELAADPAALAEHAIRALHRVGDCVCPRTAADAIFDAHRLARELDSPDPATPLPYRRERLVVTEP